MRYLTIYVEDQSLDAAANSIDEEVMRFLRQGWVLQGGTSISVSPATDDDYKEYHLAQAVVIEDELELQP